jgi:hypothetical protein
MHEANDPCLDVSSVAADEQDGSKVSCTRVSALRVGGTLTEVYRATTKDVMADQAANALVLVVHHGSKLLVSPVITASAGSKLGAYWTIDRLDARLRAIGKTAVIDLATANTYHEQRTVPPHQSRWRSHAFLACPVDGSTTCSFVAQGNDGQDCTGTIHSDGSVRFTCTTTQELMLISR